MRYPRTFRRTGLDSARFYEEADKKNLPVAPGAVDANFRSVPG
mgnify:CR=1 FL=1